MRYPIICILCLTFLVNCKLKNKSQSKAPNENFNCKAGLMDGAWYVRGIEEAIPPINLPEDFIILVDTGFKAKNFITSNESFDRTHSARLDTSSLRYSYFDETWEKLSVKEKFKLLKEQKIYYRKLADSEHVNNNSGKCQIRIINNTADTVTVQMQDGSYICVLQGFTKGGQWSPLQYWRFSSCGNSYYDEKLPPKTANSFVTNIPNRGDYVTRLRFKLLGAGKFYYSNEFSGKIDYCEFVEDTSVDNLGSRSRPHYKLDSLLHLTMF